MTLHALVFMASWFPPDSAQSSDPQHLVATTFAPLIYHATDPEEGRQDLIANVDFDHDLTGNNNWETFDSFPLIPTVYYAVLETATHYFLSYHLFHPRDWNHFTFWLHDTHENDGENLQVVVRKRDRRVVLLWTQAHYASEVHVMPWSMIAGGTTETDGPFQTVDGNGMLCDTCTHVAVFVESQGHGIYGTLSSGSGVDLRDDGAFAFDDESGILLRPARPGENVAEPETTVSGEVPYRLVSVMQTLWPALRDGVLTGDGKLLDGSYAYGDGFVSIKEVPRFYDADRYSGPFGSDRGISPFALDFDFKEGTLGALFFNPARRYLERLTIEGEWGIRYMDYPFHDSIQHPK